MERCKGGYDGKGIEPGVWKQGGMVQGGRREGGRGGGGLERVLLRGRGRMGVGDRDGRQNR